MIKKKGDFSLNEVEKKFNKFKREIPIIIGNEAENHFVDGFSKGGHQTDKSLSGWEDRKRTRDRSRNNLRRAILVKTGALRNDIKRRFTSFRKTVINVINIPYAVYHNEGSKYLPQREFIGHSRKLIGITVKIIIKELKKTFK